MTDISRYLPSPAEWDMPDNPPYTYWSYYVAQNINSLNLLRMSKVTAASLAFLVAVVYRSFRTIPHNIT